MDDYGDDDFYEYPDDLGPAEEPQKMGNTYGNRYQNAYGSYTGGYRSRGGGRGGFGPPRHFGPPPPNFGPGLPSDFGPQGPGMWPRGSPYPSRPQKHDAIKYLIKCGVPREQFRNLPRDLLELFNPDYCGLCAMGLDSHSIARIHYISKNHLKNQKKWQMNRGQGGKTTPIKSRDLYCELCDVEITSKAHSESHYAGKAHKAIVDGRKKPKNPRLLQPGMEERVKQLIKREKKCIGEEPSAAVIKAKDKHAPELYCDVCQTFVTCSEQMTIHLNGKRHLLKEKQHIMKVMKGETNQNQSSEPKNTDDDLLNTLEAELTNLPPIEDKDAGKVAENPSEQASGVADATSCDWENNGEAWDEPETRT